MANPEPESEPSMEDILASIRRIISDDEDTGDATKEADVAKPEAETKTADEVDFDAIKVDDDAPAEDEANDQSSIDDIFQLTEVVEEGAEPEEPVSQADVDEIDFDSIGDEAEDVADLDFIDAETQTAEPEPEVDFAALAADAEPQAAKPDLLSSDAQATASAAFGALASTMLSHSGGARTLEEIVEDLLRPLLKAWLDQNLPPLVEKLVREEIERVARRGH
ncbi:Cell division organizing protein PopZ [hydrothermal vent metagenome]|uniref:Cell division organizing protein PopZ n=1 Tax=hydrothermal vent metagenome TaxID=652676 RepID=A0A3B0T6U7_9ZZZZ